MKNYKFTIRGNQFDVEIKNIDGNIADIEVNGTEYKVEIQKEIKTTKTPTIVRADLPKPENVRKADAEAGKSKPTTQVKAPLPGNIIQLKIKEGDTVKKGDILLVMEAMKMENNVLSEKDGVVRSIKVSNGQAVLQNDVLIEIE
jgi:biotin carboxyl carrier protein